MKFFVVLRYLFLIIFTFFIFQDDACAQILQGTVKGENEDLIGASIILYLADTSSMVGFAISGEKGKWLIDNIAREGMVLSVSYLGFDTKYIAIDSSTLKKESISIRLKRHEERLNEVVVKAKGIAVVVKGDTINYNAKAYQNESTQTLGDVLNNMPGLEVGKGGDILYNGKRVDKILLEGKDILADQHKLATEGIQADDVKSIRIIKHYRPFNEQYLLSNSNKVAMDVRLTDEALKKVNGDAELLAGYRYKYKTNANLYRVKEKSGLTIFARANNIGESNMSSGDFLSLKGNLFQALKETKGELSKLIPEGFIPGKDVQENYDNVILGNLEINKSKYNTTNFVTMLNYAYRVRASHLQRFYDGVSVSQTGTQTREVAFPYLYSKFKRQKMLTNSKGNVTIEIPFYTDLSTNNQYYQGELAFQDTDNYFEKSKQNFTIAPVARYYKSLSKNRSYFINSQILLERIENRLSLRQKNRSSINQSKKERKENLGFDFGYVKKGKNWEVEGQAGTRLNSLNMQLHSPDSLIYNRDFQHVFWSANAVLDLRYEKNRWMENFRLESGYNHHSLDTIIGKQLFNSDFTVRYSFHPLHFFLLNLSYHQQELPYNLCYDTYEYLDANTVKYGSLILGSLSKTTGVNLSHLYFNLGNGFRSYSIVNYNFVQDPMHPEFRIENGVFLQSYLQAESQRNLSFRNDLDWEWASKNIKFKLSTSWNRTHTKVSKELKVKMQGYMQAFGIQYNPRKALELEYTYQLNRYAKNQNQATLGQKQEFKAIYTKRPIRLEGDFWLQMFKSNDISNRYDHLDIKLEYKLKNNWTLKLSGKDVFNLRPKEIYSYNQTIAYYEMVRYNRFPGSIILGAGKLF